MKTWAIALLALGAWSGCTRRNPIYCDVPADCETGACDVPHHTCVQPGDAAGGTDAVTAADATTPDANTLGPIVHTNQAADLVLGQATFDTATNPGCVQNAAGAASIAVDNGVLYIGARVESRALAWAPLPTSNNADATRVLGKSGFTSCNRPTTVGQGDFWDSVYVGAGGGKLVAGDFFRNRVLVWNPAPGVNGELADIVLGQPGFTTSGIGSGSNQLNSPFDVWTDGSRVAVADAGNNRVLIWNTFPTVNGDPADLVLGQTGFGLGGVPASPSQSNLNAPAGIWSDGSRLVVADYGHNRVLIWNSFPTTNGQAADVVIGQSTFTSGGGGLSATELRSPAGVAGTDDALFIADAINDRVLVFSPFPSVNGEAATYVLGQADLNTGANNPGPTQQTLNLPRKVVVAGAKLWVSDDLHQRALRFALYPP